MGNYAVDPPQPRVLYRKKRISERFEEIDGPTRPGASPNRIYTPSFPINLVPPTLLSKLTHLKT